jgi:hypothetical protein
LILEFFNIHNSCYTSFFGNSSYFIVNSLDLSNNLKNVQFEKSLILQVLIQKFKQEFFKIPIFIIGKYPPSIMGKMGEKKNFGNALLCRTTPSKRGIPKINGP